MSHAGVRRAFGSFLLALILVIPTPVASAASRAVAAVPAVAAAAQANDVPGVIARDAAPLEVVPGGGGATPDDGTPRTEGPAAKPPKVRTEVEALRSEYGTVFANPDGTFSAEYSGGRVNFLQPNGRWGRIESTLVSDATDGFELRTKANDRVVRIAPSRAADALAQLAAKDVKIGIRVPGLAPGQLRRDAGAVDLPAADGRSGFSVVPTPEGFEFSVTLPDAAAPAVHEVIVDAGQLVPILATDGTVLLADRKGTVIARIGAPWLSDAAEAEPGPTAVHVDLERDDSSLPAGAANALRLRNGEFRLRYTIDAAWLAAPDRAFPVLLDPTVTLQGNGSGGDVNGDGVVDSCEAANVSTNYIDHWLSSGLASSWVCWSGMRIGYDNETEGTPYSFGIMRGLFWFKGVTLGAGDGEHITSATLSLYKYSGSARSFRVAAITGPGWDNPAKWNDQQGEGGNNSIRYLCANLTSTNCTGETTSAYFTPSDATTASNSVWFDQDVTTLVRRWYTKNNADWLPNIGLMVRTATENSSNTQNKFRNGGTSTTSQRPKLVITYEAPHVKFAFDPALGPDFAPSTMPVASTVNLPVIVTNNTSGFTFKKFVTGSTDYYKVGYRWFDAKGKVMTSPAPGMVDLLADLASGATATGPVILPVVTPAAPGQYTLRLDLVHMKSGATVWASDWAAKAKYYARNKLPNTTPSNVRWVGSSVIERAEFAIGVVTGQGTAVGASQGVDLPDGSNVSINLWSRNLQYTGSGGVGFNDLLASIGLSYYYNSADTSGTGCTTILLACGWATNFDERFEPGSNGADYIYRDATGNRYFVNENAQGQLVSGAPGRIDRPRQTILDENNLAWTLLTPTQTTNAFNGTSAISLAWAGTSSAQSTDFHAISLSDYPLVSFATSTSTAGKSAIGFRIKDNEDGAINWLFYTNGGTASWAVSGFSSVWTGNYDITGDWKDYVQKNLYNDARANISGLSTDLTVLAIDLRGAPSTSGNLYFDAIRFEGRSSTAYDDTLPGGLTCNGTTCTSTQLSAVGAPQYDVFSGTAALKATSPASPGITTAPTVTSTFGLDTYPYVTWAWQKVGGSTVAMGFRLQDTRDTTKVGWIYYYAGVEPTTIGTAATRIRVSDTIPVNWTSVTRNLIEDGRQVLGFYNDNPSSTITTPGSGPVPDGVNRLAYQFIPWDGSFALFDKQFYSSIPNPGSGDQYATPIGDDFIVTLRGGEQHRFNRAGLLTSIEDRDNNRTGLDWSYTWATRTYSLDLIHAPGDGLPLASGTAVRRIDVDSTTYPNAVRFTEQLSGSSGRYTEFARAGTDLASVVPARRSAACAPSGATGCLKFTYDAAHNLTTIYDPRSTAADTKRTTIGWTSSDPTRVTFDDVAKDQLRVNWAVTQPTTGIRVMWQDADGIATGTNGYARFSDLSPNGSVRIEYRPVACAVANCTTAPSPGDKLSEFTTDGIDNFTSEIRYRLPGNAAPITTKRGTFASARVDNYADPLVAGLTAWTQSADQAAASTSTDPNNAGFVKTTLGYTPSGLTASTSTPFANPAGASAVQRLEVLYDGESHPIQAADNTFLVNPAFENALGGWTTTGVWDQATVHPGGSNGALKLTGTQTATQTVQLLPGQTFRFQAWLQSTASSATAKVEYWDTAASAYQAFAGGSTFTDPRGAWGTAPISYDLSIPVVSADGRVRVTLSTSGTSWFDDLALMTTYTSRTYLANGLPDTVTDILGRVSKTNYAPSSVHPAIFETSSVRNLITGGSAPDENVTTTRTFDSWGRPLLVTDPDGVDEETSYAANRTDVAWTEDGLDNRTEFLAYDEIGNVSSEQDELDRPTTRTFTWFGDELDVTDATGVVTHFVYDGAGRRTERWQNWLGNGSPQTGDQNVKDTQTFDELGNVLSAVEDAGVSAAYTDRTWDLAGNEITETVYSDSNTVGPRVVTAYFDAAGNTVGTRGPIAPTSGAAQCPGAPAGTLCNSVKVIDMNGRVASETNAYGKVAATWHDLAGKPVREIGNYVSGGASTADQNTSTTYRYDAADRVVSTVDPIGRTTSTIYDDLDRVTKLTRGDSTWVRTDWTPAGRKDMESRPGTPSETESDVAWTKYIYDGAGQLERTLANYDRSGAAQLQISDLEGAGPGGWASSNGFFVLPGAAVSTTADSVNPSTGQGRLRVVTSATNGYTGAVLPLGGTFKNGHTYRVRADIYGTGSLVRYFFGVNASGSPYVESSITTNGSWQTFQLDWTVPTGPDQASNVWFGVRKDAAGTVNLYVDNVTVWDLATPDRNIPTATTRDAAGQTIRSILPPGHAGEPTQVTASAYDLGGQLTSVTVNATTGAAAAGDVNLTTTYAYDALDHRTTTTDPTGVVTRNDYDRRGNITAATLNSITGGTPSATVNVKALFAYNDRDELVATCSPQPVLNGCSNPASDSRAWRYTFDAAGHIVGEVPPDNTTGTDLSASTYVYDPVSGGDRLIRTCDHPAGGSCANATRYTTTDYDNLGRVTSTVTYLGAYPSTTEKVRTTTAYDAAGQQTSVAYSVDGVAADTLTFGYDLGGHQTTVSRTGVGTLTTSTYNPDGTLATRIDHAINPTTPSTFIYDDLGRLTGSTSPLYTGTASFTWRLDGLIDGRTWPTGGNTATFAYDALKRPTGMTELRSGVSQASFGRQYDRQGNVVSETQTLPGISGIAGSGEQSFTYDALRRVTGSSISGAPDKGYTYNADSARLTVTEGLATTIYAYNETNELVTQTQSGIPKSFTYDVYGNMTTSAVGNAPTDTAAPTTPTGVSATAVAVNRVNVSWTGSTDNAGVTSYEVYRNGILVTAVSGTTTTFIDWSVAKNTAYAYTVRAKDAAGNTSATSSAGSATTPNGNAGNDNTSPSTPTGLSATAVSSSQVNLSWTASTDNVGVQGYQVRRNGVLVATVGSTTWSETGLTASTAYSWTVTAIDGSANSSAASTAAGTTTPAAVVTQTTYTYDHLDRLTSITAPSGGAATFTLDALGRHRSRQVGSTTEAFEYAGTSEAVVRISQPSLTIDSAVDAMANRIATKSSGSTTAFGWLLPDLHGNVSAAVGSSGLSLTDAFRYDAYGVTIDDATSSLPTPWRFQGRMLLNTSGNTDLYDFIARAYDPTLGMFTSLDTVKGGAQNPITLNRFLYANANPESLVDPDGHDGFDPFGFIGGIVQGAGEVAGNVVAFGQGVVDGAAEMAGGIIETVKAAPGAVASAVGCVANSTCRNAAIQTAQNAVTQFARDPVGSIRRGAAAVGQAIGGAISSTVNRVKTAWETGNWRELGKFTFEVGSNFIPFGGIASKIGALGRLASASRFGGAVSNLAGRGLTAVRGALDAARALPGKARVFLDDLASDTIRPWALNRITRTAVRDVDDAIARGDRGFLERTGTHGGQATGAMGGNQAFRGTAIHNVAAVRATSGLNRILLRGVHVTRNFEYGPDFYSNLTRRAWDITKPARVATHVRQYVTHPPIWRPAWRTLKGLEYN